MTHPDPESSSRVRLVEAAILCFAEKGFDATGIREIAQRANANSALVQYHFGGKTGLYAAALHHIFTRHPLQVPRPPDRPDEPDARPRAIRALGEMLEASIHEFMAARSGGELDRASLILVTREMQSPRADMPDLVVGHLRPYNEIILGCVKVLRPDLGEEEVLDHTISIFSQVTHLLNHLHILRLFRNDPEYPRDLGALARHITAFSLRGLGIPEAFPGA
jgi:AcrR family transcriptional regulator